MQRHSAGTSAPSNSLKSTSLWMALAAFAVPCTDAVAGTPRIGSCYPAVAQRGTEQEVIFSGSNLSDARTVLFDSPGFEVTKVKTETNRFTVKIRVPADADLGEHTCRVITDSGVADVRVFLVSPFPVVEELYPKVVNSPARIAQRTVEPGCRDHGDREPVNVRFTGLRSRACCWSGWCVRRNTSVA